jgi:hypothetical protein
MSNRHRSRVEVFVVLRADLFQAVDAAPETLVTAKEVLLSRDQADSEVRRLNALHTDGRVRYCLCSRGCSAMARTGLAAR